MPHYRKDALQNLLNSPTSSRDVLFGPGADARNVRKWRVMNIDDFLHMATNGNWWNFQAFLPTDLRTA